MKLRYALPKNLQNNGVDHIDVKFTADQIRAVWNKYVIFLKKTLLKKIIILIPNFFIID